MFLSSICKQAGCTCSNRQQRPASSWIQVWQVWSTVSSRYFVVGGQMAGCRHILTGLLKQVEPLLLDQTWKSGKIKPTYLVECFLSFSSDFFLYGAFFKLANGHKLLCFSEDIVRLKSTLQYLQTKNTQTSLWTIPNTKLLMQVYTFFLWQPVDSYKLEFK